ncbi:glycosyltransferase family 4 protein [Streptococcus sp. 121]|uniref:glycosyltransferase family 4 protein n=1 Tax=Streptococcus sp. 121 TaxID=2797637 RepID=UPI0018F085EF|nr:glycosyltransferase family 4 protein [Streptococcus sp. 121]MBJ6746080.1 glycosyltransferase family 4 protein [Streptococcus sp. 121]
MEITFCLPGMSRKPVGGFKIVFEFANRLVERGHQVNLVFMVDSSFSNIPFNLYFKDKFGKILSPWFPQWFKLNPKVKKIVTAYRDGRAFPDADFVFATAVETAKLVKNLPTRCGEKLYLIQDFENWKYSDDEVIDTYKFGMKNIVISKWLLNVVKEYDEEVSLISNAIDVESFYVSQPIEMRDKFQIAMLYHTKAHKGVPIAMDAIRKVKATYPKLHLNLFGAYERPSFYDSKWMTYTQHASPEQLHKIYNMSSIFICASVKEGFGLTGAESLACGCALASTSYEGVFDYAEDGKTALLSPINDSDALAENIIHLIEDDQLRYSLGMNGSQKLKAFSWDENVTRLEMILQNG